MVIASWQKAPSRARARLPWPLPMRPTRICICESNGSRYLIGVSLKQYDKDDPRGVLVLEGQKSGRGACLLYLGSWRIPLAGLRRARAEKAFAELVGFLRSRAEIDA